MKAIVIGGVAAGMSAASKLRRVMPDAQITVYERGGYLSYGACGLPYYIGGFNDDPGRLIARTREQYAQMRIDTFLHHEVLSVDAAAKRVRVRDNDSGREFEDSYDALMIAVGCDSVAPKVPGADLPSVFYLKTMEDGLLLREIARLKDVHHVAVVGGGYIGVEMTEALLHTWARPSRSSRRGSGCSPRLNPNFPNWPLRSWRKTACGCWWATAWRRLPNRATAAWCARAGRIFPATWW